MAVQTSIRRQIGESGLADIRVGKKSVRVQFEDSGMVFEVSSENWDSDRPNGQYNVTLTKDNSKILSLKPVPGSYIMVFKEMSNRVNGVPETSINRGGTRRSKDGSKQWFQPDSLVWRVNLEILSEGRFKGLTVMYSIPYIFAPVQGTPYAQLQGDSKAELERTESFLRLAGFDLASSDIPYSQNVLPWLEQQIQKSAKPFLGTINEKGFPGEFSLLPPELAPKLKTKVTKKGKK